MVKKGAQSVPMMKKSTFLTITDRGSKLLYAISILLFLIATFISIKINAQNNADTDVYTKNCEILSECIEQLQSRENHDWDYTIILIVTLLFSNIIVGMIRYRYIAKRQHYPIRDGILVLCQWGLLFGFYFVCLNVLARSVTIPIESGEVSIAKGNVYSNMTILSDWVSNTSRIMGENQKSLGYFLGFVILISFSQVLSSLGCMYKKIHDEKDSNRKSMKITLNSVARNTQEIGYILSSLSAIIVGFVYYNKVSNLPQPNFRIDMYHAQKGQFDTYAEYFTVLMVNGSLSECNITGYTPPIHDDNLKYLNCSIFGVSNTCTPSSDTWKTTDNMASLSLAANILEVLSLMGYVGFIVIAHTSDWKMFKKIVRASTFFVNCVSTIFFLTIIYQTQTLNLSKECQTTALMNGNEGNKVSIYIVVVVALLLTRLAYQNQNYDSNSGTNTPSDEISVPGKHGEGNVDYFPKSKSSKSAAAA